MKPLLINVLMLCIVASCQNIKKNNSNETIITNDLDSNLIKELYYKKNNIEIYDTGYYFRYINARPSKDFFTWIYRCKKDTNLVAIDSSKVNMVDPLNAIYLSYISCIPDFGTDHKKDDLKKVIEYAWNYSFYHKGIRKRIDIFQLKINREKLNRIKGIYDGNGHISDYENIYEMPIEKYKTTKSVGSSELLVKVFDCEKDSYDKVKKEMEQEVLYLADGLKFED